MSIFRMAAVAAVLSFALQAETLAVPRPAPEFVVHYPDGSQALLSSSKGKVVALTFIYTTCIHCQHASQAFSKLYTEYSPRGFQVVSVAFNEMANLFVSDFVKNNGITFKVGFSPLDPVLQFLGISPIERYEVPQIVWIDRNGIIRAQTPAIGDDGKMRTEGYWREMIETLLKEPVSAKKHPGARASAAKKSEP
jgi:peroxiredoxin